MRRLISRSRCKTTWRCCRRTGNSSHETDGLRPPQKSASADLAAMLRADRRFDIAAEKSARFCFSRTCKVARSGPINAVSRRFRCSLENGPSQTISKRIRPCDDLLQHANRRLEHIVAGSASPGETLPRLFDLVSGSSSSSPTQQAAVAHLRQIKLHRIGRILTHSASLSLFRRSYGVAAASQPHFPLTMLRIATAFGSRGGRPANTSLRKWPAKRLPPEHGNSSDRGDWIACPVSTQNSDGGLGTIRHSAPFGTSHPTYAAGSAAANATIVIRF